MIILFFHLLSEGGELTDAPDFDYFNSVVPHTFLTAVISAQLNYPASKAKGKNKKEKRMDGWLLADDYFLPGEVN
jgi:hypothetical protein